MKWNDTAPLICGQQAKTKESRAEVESHTVRTMLLKMLMMMLLWTI